MNKPKNSRTIDEALAAVSSLQALSMNFWNEAFSAGRKLSDEWMQSFASVSPVAKARHAVPCCPPEEECPPHCLTMINREAHPGEVIIVPFAVKNCCGGPKTYKVGVRPLKDQDGQEAPVQPQLDKQELTLDPGQAIQVRLRVDLSQGFHSGSTYKTEIVVREKEVNQNICFTLRIRDAVQGPVICPLEESAYFNHFHGWDSHFYCEKPRGARIITNLSETKKKG